MDSLTKASGVAVSVLVAATASVLLLLPGLLLRILPALLSALAGLLLLLAGLLLRILALLAALIFH